MSEQNNGNSGNVGRPIKQSAGKTILNGFLMGLGMTVAHKVVDAADHAARNNDQSDLNNIDDNFGGMSG